MNDRVWCKAPCRCTSLCVFAPLRKKFFNSRVTWQTHFALILAGLGHNDPFSTTKNCRAYADPRRDARRGGAGRRDVSRARRRAAHSAERMGGVVAADHAYVVHFAFAGIYLFFVISGFCIHLFWAKARAAGVEKPVIDFFTFWKRRVRRLYPPLRRARDLPVLSRIQDSGTRHGFLPLGRSASCLHVAQPRLAYDLHDKRRILDTRNRRTTVPRLFPAALPADPFRFDQDVACAFPRELPGSFWAAP